MNYFNLFDLPLTFNLKQKDIKNKFYQLQKKYHPDLYMHIEEKKRLHFMQNSILINKAYQILKNPITRAEHLISLHQSNIKKKTNCDQYNKFLSFQFYLYEKLENFKKDNQYKKINVFYKKITKIEIYLSNKLQQYLYAKNWEKAKNNLEKLKYFLKFKITIEKTMSSIHLQ
ncbi:Co-chaperone protein HscB [Buchnera aphidicola (Thelaxes suberi)]|uniref:Fe-S protein assembly co-chaperone HscB n=1 Tax=Buchnera aphidicola TaxID=9 RepID=UPI003464B6A6